ncbi:hypothetical protein ABTJ99_21630, partial [Acinetobacter baumannii]
NAQGIGTILLVRPDGRLLRAWHDGRRTDDIAYAHLRWQIEGLVAGALRGDHTIDPRKGTMRLPDGTVWPTNAEGMPGAV